MATKELQVRNNDQASIMESVLIKGNLADLTPQERNNYYMKTCESLGLNPLTKPFEFIELNGKLTLYVKKDATDQLRNINNISISIVSREKMDDVYVVTARAETRDGRVDESIGIVSIAKEDGEWTQSTTGKKYFKGNGQFKQLRGDELANALMKAETKAKRRVTLSISGLGWTDESEIDSIPNAKPVQIDHNTGEIKVDTCKACGVEVDEHTAEKSILRFGEVYCVKCGKELLKKPDRPVIDDPLDYPADETPLEMER